ncbi:MAG: copper transporter [Mycobacteriaceae bacterium]|nr:copper transporter [Mycobacteriaceae bacterium]
MISLRQHAISLAAVFLALAVGIVLGSGFPSHTLLSAMSMEKRDLHAQIDALGEQKNALNQKLHAANDFDVQLAGRMIHNTLAGKSVVIFVTPDANADDVAAVSKMVSQAGGSVAITVSLTQEFVEANSAEKLRSVVNSSILPAGAQLSTNLVDQGSQAGDLLGIVLLTKDQPAGPLVDDAQRNTVLAALRDTGFIVYPAQGGIGAATAALVITGGALPEDAGNQGATVARFTVALAPHGAGTLLAGREGSSTGTAAVALSRADAGMAQAISTVDNVNSESGRITAILGLNELISGGDTGQYGIGHGATSVTVAQ